MGGIMVASGGAGAAYAVFRLRKSYDKPVVFDIDCNEPDLMDTNLA